MKDSEKLTECAVSPKRVVDSERATPASQYDTSDPSDDIKDCDRSEHAEQVDQPPAYDSGCMRFGDSCDGNIDKEDCYDDYDDSDRERDVHGLHVNSRIDMLSGGGTQLLRTVFSARRMTSRIGTSVSAAITLASSYSALTS